MSSEPKMSKLNEGKLVGGSYMRAGEAEISEGGMTMLEWYAGQAMQGILTTAPGMRATPSKMAEVAFNLAEAMVAEYEKRVARK